MDPARPLLLGLLIALDVACAAWVPGEHVAFESALVPAAEPLLAAEPRCDTAPTIAALRQGNAVVDACAPLVALYRRDVVGADQPELVGLCSVPCLDPIASRGVVAYTTRAMAADQAGPLSPETYVNCALTGAE